MKSLRKRTLFLIILIVSSVSVFSLNSSQIDTTKMVIVEQMPSFPGGDAALIRFLNNTVKYPKYAIKKGIQGRVMCQFVINPDSTIVEVKVVKSVHPSLDKEAVRVLKLMPKWIPGKRDGKNVRVKYTMPVNFRLN